MTSHKKPNVVSDYYKMTGEGESTLSAAMKALQAQLARRRASTNPKPRKKPKKEVSEATNPWAVCHSSVGKKKTAKFERCVQKVKKSSDLKEMVMNTIIDLMINEAERRPRASREELRHRRDAWLANIAKTRHTHPKSMEKFKQYLAVTNRQNKERYDEDPPVEDGSA